MAELFSRYESGAQFTAGAMVGSVVGVSGVNAFVDRLNSITDTDGEILPTITTPTTPIGSVLAWLKSFTNTPALPDGFVECNGQVLSDADSVYNGQTLPDLNGDNRFLRGNSTTGGTGGSETMAHTHILSGVNDELSQNGTTYDGITSRTTGAATNDENRPPFYNIVWIIRIK